MQFFVDSDDVQAIAELADIGMVDGVTTNPMILARTQGDPRARIAAICQIVSTSVSVEVMASEYEQMLKEAAQWRELGPQITIKLPMSWQGLRACRTMSKQNIPVNMTLCFSPTQALMAAKAGAAYVSPFVGRLDDVGQDGMGMVDTICQIFSQYPDITTQVLVASVRSPQHVIQAGLCGADIVTANPQLLRSLVEHPLSDLGIAKFESAWEKAYGSSKK